MYDESESMMHDSVDGDDPIYEEMRKHRENIVTQE